MLNFLYCFDNKYNVQAFTSIYSLLKNINTSINLFIIHETEQSENFIPKKILENKNLNIIKIYKFDIQDIDFYNLENSHVSIATFFRLFLTKYLPENLMDIIYIDSDIYCINNPEIEFKQFLKKLVNSNYEVGFSTEVNREDEPILFNRLSLSGNTYFNAGVMLMDLEKARKNFFDRNILKTLKELNTNAVFWDQDILNKYYDNNYLKISTNLNFKINELKDYKLDEEYNSKKVKLVHYSGKFKPWSLKGLLHPNSHIFQDYYSELFGERYYISSSRKLLVLKDFFNLMLKFNFKNIKYPSKLFIRIFKYLLKGNLS